MKIKSLILAMAACAGLFSACSNEIDEFNPDNNQNDVKDAYASFSFIMPNSGAATRTNPNGGQNGDGKEEGLGVENMVSNVNIYLFKGDLCAQVTPLNRNDFTPTNNGSAIEYKTIKPIAVNTGDYNVYIIVNPTSNLETNVKEGVSYNDFINAVEKVKATTGEYCTDNHFMMTNADVKADTEISVTEKNTEKSPAAIAINVERTSAKITFNFKGDKNEFPIEDGNGNAVGTVVFDAYKIINTKSNAYNFRKVGTSFADAVQGEKEIINTNYVIENFFDKKGSFDSEFFANNYSRKYNTYVAFRTLNGINPKTNAAPQILAYCLENTMPVDRQVNGYTTTVIFRAKATITGINDGTNKDLYRYNNKFYANLYDLVTASNPGWDQTGKVAVDVIGINDAIEAGKTVEAYINEIYTDANTLRNKYAVDYYMQGYCYYPYYIRHANNNNDNEMGVMEFAIVRNNVYKLTINSVAQIGDITSGTNGPKDPENPTEPDVDPKKPNPEIPGEIAPDPEPETPPTPIDPENPDESTKSFLNVTIDVLPWIVRNNDINL